MNEQTEEPLSPTVKKVLDGYIDALKKDSGLDGEKVDRLADLLRQGKIPRPADLDAVLFPASEAEGAS